MENYITFKNVSKFYQINSQKIKALDQVSFSIQEGEFCVVVGESGAGKTTILNILGGMDHLSSGEVKVANIAISNMNSFDLTKYRRESVGFVFQFYNLVQNLTALENVELATEICSNPLDPKTILKEVGLENRLNNFSSQLSGGEQQRVSIARALAKNPKMLLCDEPTGALDYKTGKNILSLLKETCKKKHKTVIIITHNKAIKPIADRIISVRSGQVVEIVKNSNPKDIGDIEW